MDKRLKKGGQGVDKRWKKGDQEVDKRWKKGGQEVDKRWLCDAGGGLAVETGRGKGNSTVPEVHPATGNR